MPTDKQQQLFHGMIEEHKGILFKVARTYCQNAEDRQDLVQEIMIQAWRSLAKYDPAYKITTWLYRISLNVAISFYRKNAARNSRNIPLNDQLSLVSDADKPDQEQQLNLLEQFINELKEIDKALMLLYLEEKPYKEIAEILGISESNVATKIGRIKSVLKQKFSRIKNQE